MVRQATGDRPRFPGAPFRRGWQVLLLVLAVLLGLGLALQPRGAAPAHGAPLAPDFRLAVASGGRGVVSLRAFRGHVVLINFFNSNCPPCLDELAVLRQTARAYHPHGVVVLGVASGGDTFETASRLAHAARLPYPVVVDEHQGVAWQYQVGAWPTSFFIDAAGRVQGQYVGPLDDRTIRGGLSQAGAGRCAGCDPLPRPTLEGTTAGASAAGSISADVVYTPPKAAPGFVLRDQQGRPVSPASLSGEVVALTFISAACREQCPLVGQTITLARHLLGPLSDHLAIVAISVDPEQDTPHTIQSFATEAGWQGADWHYLGGTRAELSRIWAAYGVYVPTPAPIFKSGSTIVHQAQLFILDQQGRLRAYYDAPFLASRAAATVRTLLAGTEGHR